MPLDDEFGQMLDKLKTLRDGCSGPQREELSDRIDEMLEQEIDLTNATIEKTSQQFIEAQQAVQQALASVEEALQQPAKVANAIGNLAKVISKVSRLLA